jgi:hypothetical protein
MVLLRGAGADLDKERTITVRRAGTQEGSTQTNRVGM